MKRLTTLGGALAVAAFALSSAQAGSVDTKTANVSVTIAGVNTISLAIKNMDGTAATEIGFANVDPGGSTWAAKGSQFVQLSVVDNINTGWELRNYTDNFNFAGGILPDTTTWGYQYGGLRNVDVNGQRAGVGWMVLPDSDVAKNFQGPDAANPVDGASNGYTFLKDRSDQNPPLVTDQSFDGSGGYKNVAFGSLTETRIVRPNRPGGNDVLSGKTAPFFYFLGGDFKGVAPGHYTATITFELMNL
ncbi:MAG TPA: hypothetical protein PKB12_08865 [Elusimicrobiota bacterium]|jgi:hypothetical protein|nr:hypothetical protein [Elusimicrobiota bacterium]HMX43811.1 hypothetical protein [Elusimicrobiota bacterium]HMX94152.1 hypothetical protein [Elusimicrobiota bacterium]HMZ25720.1 hypothetical protein [Elusimicrobiota bacterium]HNA59437.1 hypothetical protein [Elusimicrobiota bacterium]